MVEAIRTSPDPRWYRNIPAHMSAFEGTGGDANTRRPGDAGEGARTGADPQRAQ